MGGVVSLYVCVCERVQPWCLPLMGSEGQQHLGEKVKLRCCQLWLNVSAVAPVGQVLSHAIAPILPIAYFHSPHVPSISSSFCSHFIVFWFFCISTKSSSVVYKYFKFSIHASSTWAVCDQWSSV